MGYVIALGDIHGQMGVFPRLEAMRAKYPDARVVFIGDYVDGHKQGFAVLERIRQLQRDDPEHVTVLRGNHEQMMLDFLADYTQENWLFNGGRATMREAVVRKLGHAAGTLQNRLAVKHEYADLLAWVAQLPLDYQVQHVRLVHAGYNLQLVDPLTFTPPDFKLWAREEYWYGTSGPVFAQNPLPATIVSGHTPTGYISGRYRQDVLPPKQTDLQHHPIYSVQYPGEYPRVFIDGGNHGGDALRCGNIAVFTAENGALIDSLQD